MSSGKHNGGWNEPEKGTIDGHEVTFASGWGSKEGQVLIADGVDWDEDQYHTGSNDDFFNSDNHDHYGSGKGSHNNGTYRGRYTGPGC